MLLEQALASNSCSGFSEEELAEIRAAANQYVSANNAFMKLVNLAASKADSALKALLKPEWQEQLNAAIEAALTVSFHAADALNGNAREDGWKARVLDWAKGERWHQIASAVTGAIGGAGGTATTLLDLPVTITLILRSIQQIAQTYGEDISSEDARRACIDVFLLGGPPPDDNDSNVGLIAARFAFSSKGTAQLIREAAVRLGVPVAEKVLAQATPILGAFAGGAINPLFTTYYQNMAHVQFRLRRLDRVHDGNQVRSCFERIVRAILVGQASSRQ